MASTVTTMTEIQRLRTKYHWPAMQLNFWICFMMVGSATVMGIFSLFVMVQKQLQAGIPWYFSYWVTVGSISLAFIIIMLWLISKRQLLPGIVIMGSFILFVLWLVGLIVVSRELWGPTGSVSSNCQLYVEGHEVTGPSQETLAWLEQHSICQGWQVAWAFQLLGCIFLLWMMIMAYQVFQDDA